MLAWMLATYLTTPLTVHQHSPESVVASLLAYVLVLVRNRQQNSEMLSSSTLSRCSTCFMRGRHAEISMRASSRNKISNHYVILKPKSLRVIMCCSTTSEAQPQPRQHRHNHGCALINQIRGQPKARQSQNIFTVDKIINRQASKRGLCCGAMMQRTRIRARALHPNSSAMML